MRREFRYSVKLGLASGYMTPAVWATKSLTGYKIPAYLTGVPTDAKLARYVADYNASLAPGGVNSHLGLGATAVAARIYDHRAGHHVAEWTAPDTYTAGGRVFTGPDAAYDYANDYHGKTGVFLGVEKANASRLPEGA